MEQEKDKQIVKKEDADTMTFEGIVSAMEKGFDDSQLHYALEILRNASSYLTNKELYDGVEIKFLTNAFRTGRWERGQNPKYSFLVSDMTEIKRFDTDLKFLMFLIPFLSKNGIKDVRGKILKIKKERDEKGRVKYLLELK